MSNSFYNYQKVENGQNISSIPLRNFISNKCISKKYKNRIMPINNKIQENKDKNHSQIILNSENIISNDNTKYIHCKRHPKNIIRMIELFLVYYVYQSMMSIHIKSVISQKIILIKKC